MVRSIDFSISKNLVNILLMHPFSKYVWNWLDYCNSVILFETMFREIMEWNNIDMPSVPSGYDCTLVREKKHVTDKHRNLSVWRCVSDKFKYETIKK